MSAARLEPAWKTSRLSQIEPSGVRADVAQTSPAQGRPSSAISMRRSSLDKGRFGERGSG
jgi:hypothetical protein